jgi:DNA-binding MarR family transcriptional regulator
VYEKLTEPNTATELSKELKKHRSSISRVLLEMERKGLISCVNPEDDRFRHYEGLINVPQTVLYESVISSI